MEAEWKDHSARTLLEHAQLLYPAVTEPWSSSDFQLAGAPSQPDAYFLGRLAAWVLAQGGVRSAFIEDRADHSRTMYVCHESEDLAAIDAFYDRLIERLEQLDPSAEYPIDVEVVPERRASGMSRQLGIRELRASDVEAALGT